MIGKLTLFLALLVAGVTASSGMARTKTLVDCVSLRDPRYRLEVFLAPDPAHQQQITVLEMRFDSQVSFRDYPVQQTATGEGRVFAGPHFTFVLKESPTTHGLYGQVTNAQGSVGPALTCQALR